MRNFTAEDGGRWWETAREEQKREKPLGDITLVKISIDLVKRASSRRGVCEVIHFFKMGRQRQQKRRL